MAGTPVPNRSRSGSRDHPERWPTGAVVPSRATINRVLERRGQIVRVPQRRPRRSRRRFEAAHPNTMWQMDGFAYSIWPMGAGW